MEFHEFSLMQCVGENMDFFEAKEKGQGMMGKII